MNRGLVETGYFVCIILLTTYVSETYPAKPGSGIIRPKAMPSVPFQKTTAKLSKKMVPTAPPVVKIVASVPKEPKTKSPVKVQKIASIAHTELTTGITTTTLKMTPDIEYMKPSKPQYEYDIPSKPQYEYGIPSQPQFEYEIPSTPQFEYGIPSQPQFEYEIPSTPQFEYGIPSTPQFDFAMPSQPPSASPMKMIVSRNPKSTTTTIPRFSEKVVPEFDAMIPQFSPSTQKPEYAYGMPTVPMFYEDIVPDDEAVIPQSARTTQETALNIPQSQFSSDSEIAAGEVLANSFLRSNENTSNTLSNPDASRTEYALSRYPTDVDLKRLYSYLLSNYDTRVRPKLNQSHTTVVTVFFSILNILDFQTSSQTFDFLGYFYFVWEDDFLTWKPRQYSGLRWIKVPMTEIWTPQLMIANMYSGDSKIGDSTDRVLVTYNGKVSWVPEATYKIICEVEIEYYPFDKQTCRLTFHVSDEMITEVDLVTDKKHNGIRTDHYIENSEWKLINASVDKYTISGVSYMDIVFVVERRLEFIFFTTVAPLLLFSVLNLCAFLIPVESEEKGEYSVTIVITYGVFISHISESLPPNSMTIPFFLLYMIWLLAFSVSTVVYSIIQSRLFSHYGKRGVGMKPLSCCFGKKRGSAHGKFGRASDRSSPKIMNNIEEVTDMEGSNMLCGEILRKLDVIMIVVYILSISGTTAYFFFSMKIASTF